MGDSGGGGVGVGVGGLLEEGGGENIKISWHTNTIPESIPFARWEIRAQQTCTR